MNKEREEFLEKGTEMRLQEARLNTLLQALRGNNFRLIKDSSEEDDIYPVLVKNEAYSNKIATEQMQKGKDTSKEGDIILVVANQEEVRGFSQNAKIRRIIVGGDQPENDEDKVVLLFGSRGAGKTSLIGSIINYLYDVKKEDPFRFVLGKSSEPTDCLTEYVINRSILSYRVTVVDTPGVLDVKGYKGTSNLIREWFVQQLKETGKFRLDAITLVLKNDEEELGWPYIHELAEVKRMFGDDLKTNVLPVITHSDVLPQPLAVRALAYANVTFLEYYKVNNSGFQPADSTISKLKRNQFFDHGSMSLERYFTDLHELACPLFSVLSSSARLNPK